MTAAAFGSRAAVRRALALLPDAGRLSLAAPLAAAIGNGPIAPGEAGELLAAYLLDRTAGAILATTEARARWLDGPLFTWVGPGNASPITDQVAALVAGPVLAAGGALSPVAVAERFAPRADDAVALAVAALALPTQAAAVETLFADPGPDAARLALSTVQCGRVLAWSPHLLEYPIADAVVGALVALLDPTRPRPLLDEVARCLGPLASRSGPLGERIRAAALAGIDAAARPAPASFAAEIAAIGKRRTIPDQDRMTGLPRREVAAACAYILGFASPIERAAFDAHRILVLERPGAEDLFTPFLDGLVAAAHVPAVTELVASLLVDDDDGAAETIALALAIAATLPLDELAPAFVATLEDANASRRALACAAVELLDRGDGAIDRAIAARLGDPSPDVAAAATRTLVARGRRDLLVEHGARESHPVRRAIVRAGLGELDVAVVGELVQGVTAEDPSAESTADASPLTYLIGDCLLRSVEGLAVAADLIGGVPEAAGLLALAANTIARDVGVLAPPAERQLLAAATLRVATSPDTDAELGALALYLLARESAGDPTIADVIADALDATDGQAGTLVAALGELRVATDATARALAPLVGSDQPIGARVIAAAVCGRALPARHPAWAHVRDLLELGTIARAAAWSALRDRARRTPAG